MKFFLVYAVSFPKWKAYHFGRVREPVFLSFSHALGEQHICNGVFVIYYIYSITCTYSICTSLFKLTFFIQVPYESVTYKYCISATHM